mgnify:CR=1 FL=1
MNGKHLRELRLHRGVAVACFGDEGLAFGGWEFDRLFKVNFEDLPALRLGIVGVLCHLG